MWRWTGITLGIVLVLALIWQLRQDTPTDPTAEDTIIESEPDIYAQEVQYTQLRADGSLQYQLEAGAIRQFQDDNLTSMTSPRLTLLNPDQAPWDIRSNHGYIRGATGVEQDNQEVVYLREEVIVEQNNIQQGLITMRSEAMYFYPDRQYAETDQGVMIDTEVGRTRAASMQAFLETGLLSLSSNETQRVHTIVLPEQFKKR
jgi:LPS export ABC transporter protein LptC